MIIIILELFYLHFKLSDVNIINNNGADNANVTDNE